MEVKIIDNYTSIIETQPSGLYREVVSGCRWFHCINLLLSVGAGLECFASRKLQTNADRPTEFCDDFILPGDRDVVHYPECIATYSQQTDGTFVAEVSQLYDL